MLDKLPKIVWHDPNVFWLDPACGDGRFLKRLCERGVNKSNIYGVDIQLDNCEIAAQYGNVMCADALKLSWSRKFNIIVGNPPYQPEVKFNTGGTGSRNVIWDKFVGLSLDLLTPNGFLCFVHPAKWRKPLDELGRRMRAKQFLYLEIHNDRDRLFKGSTRFDWYVLQNCPALDPTLVKDELGNEHMIDITEGDFIPNFGFDLLDRIWTKGDPCEIMFSRCAYGTDARNAHMSEQQTDEFRYPCVAATGKNGVRCWFSSRRGEFFGVPKVIFGDGRYIANAVVDWDGEYAMTQHAMAIPISSKAEGEQIKKALESDKFNTFLKSCRWSTFQIDWRVFTCLRKDFWKEFV